MSIARWLLAAVITLAPLAPSAHAQADTRRQQVLSDMGKQFREWRKADGKDAEPDVVRETADQMLGAAGIGVMDLNYWEIRLLADVLKASSSIDAVRERLGELSVFENADGAAAAMMAANLTPMDGAPAADRAAAYAHVLRHPFLGAALVAAPPEAVQCLWGMAEQVNTDRAVLDALRADLPLLTKALPDTPSRDVVAASAAVARAMAEAGSSYDDLRTPLRARLLTLAQFGRDQADDKTRVRWERLINLISSKSMDGPVVGNPAAPLTITWSSDPAIKTIDDLKGKVIVIDFWATWCGPCNASFPNVRELTARYQGYPVVILGVTSLQGRHIGPDGPIDTKDDPAKEHELMPEFIARKELTWPVVFTEQPAHNPDFGVVGIPHVTIIDPAGVVRHNALSPFDPLEEKAKKIDAILAEFKLASPARSAG